MKFVDKITKNKYFQKATETEFIKKKIEEVSNTPLLLTVELQECKGTLAVNIPPPPTDRIWYASIPSLTNAQRTERIETKRQSRIVPDAVEMASIHKSNKLLVTIR